MTLKQKKYLVLALGLVWLAGFGIWAWVRFPHLAWLALGLEIVNCGGCALVLGLFWASRRRVGR